MSTRFSHLLSPIRIGSHILKSRMIAPQALPHYLQGSEPYPGDATIAHVANIARNGAAIVAFLPMGAFASKYGRKKTILCGVALLTGSAGLCELPVKDRNGRTLTLTLTDGSSRLRPVWDEEGALVGLDVDARATAILSESGEGSGEDYEQSLTALLEQELSARIAAVLTLERQLGADFLGLEERLSRTESARIDAMNEPFEEALEDLRFQVSVSGQLTHTGDLREDLT